jgi:mannobiose 2-epimerase
MVSNKPLWLVLPLLASTPAGVIAPESTPQVSPTERETRPKPFTYLAATRPNTLALASEAETMLARDVLDVWFPRTVDNENGGFRSEFGRDWQPGKSEGKFSVFQARMTWISAEIAMRRPRMKERFLPIVRHGVDFLTNLMWDKQYGGFFWGLGDKGEITSVYTDGKDLYGISFCIYGLAAAYQATHDPRALEFAKLGFHWIEEHAHDANNGGYFEWLNRAGKVVQGDPDAVKLNGVPLAMFPIGYKSMNTHIHLLEAFTQLYEVWKDDSLRLRLKELLSINRDKICVQPGVMNLYFTNDWRPIPDHDSYGHDVETAYLMLEAETALGGGHDPRTVRIARQLVDHALAYGEDEANGGFYRDGVTFGNPEDKLKEWWVQMEGLNSLLLMHAEYGRQTDRYWKAFQRQWRFIQNHQVDAQFHGLYEMVGPDGKVVNANKGRIWKAAYHDGRALLNITERLRKLAETK